MISETLDRAGAGVGAACSPGTRITRSLLGYGAAAGPFYVLAVLAQALVRPGFNLAHDDASLLSNGSLGWIQIANFLLTGLMVIACAVGVRRALAGGRAGTWGPILLSLYGLGGILHIVSAAIGFFGFAAACFVIAQRFARDRRPAWAWASRLTGIVFLAGFAGLASGSDGAIVVLGFWVALLIAWGWLAALAIRLYRELA